ncbi:MAG: three-helix bundle dimerization domain-containing protein [Ilumatobacteraceae bacterium]
MNYLVRPSSNGHLANTTLVTAGDIRQVVDELHDRFGSVLSVEAIERCVEEAAASFEGARISSFLPILVHKAARRELERLERSTRWAAITR